MVAIKKDTNVAMQVVSYFLTQEVQQSNKKQNRNVLKNILRYKSPYFIANKVDIQLNINKDK